MSERGDQNDEPQSEAAAPDSPSPTQRTLPGIANEDAVALAQLEANAKRPKGSRKVFCDEYLVDHNGTRAYRVAFPGCTSNQAAAVAAARLLRKAKVAKYIAERQNADAALANATRERAIARLTARAFGDRRTVAQWNDKEGLKLTPSAELSMDEAALVDEISETQGKNGRILRRVRFADADKAIDKLARLQGWVVEKHEVTVNDMADRAAKARERALKRGAK